MLDPGYEFLKGYSIPTGADINVYRRHIDDNLPAVDVPEVVGLNQNADLTYRLQQVPLRRPPAAPRPRCQAAASASRRRRASADADTARAPTQARCRN